MGKLVGVKAAGFYTEPVRDARNGDKAGLDVVSVSGQRAVLSRLKRSTGPKVGKQYVSLEQFEELVLPTLVEGNGVQLHVVDEVTRQALCSERFKAALLKLLASPTAVVFGSLPAPRYGNTIDLVEQVKARADTSIVTLSKANCAGTSQQVATLLRNLLGVEAAKPSVAPAPKAVPPRAAVPRSPRSPAATSPRPERPPGAPLPRMPSGGSLADRADEEGDRTLASKLYAAARRPLDGPTDAVDPKRPRLQ